MEIKASGKNIGVSSIKARIPADVVRNMNAQEAVAILTYMRKGTALHVKKVIESAMANAKNNYNLDPKDLYVTEINVSKGPQTKFNTRRIIRAARGRSKFFDRKYCHITVVLTDIKSETTKSKKEKIEIKKEVKKEELKVEKTKTVKAKKSTKKNK